MKKSTFIYLFSEKEYANYFGVIYKITNIINSKIYIGQSIHFWDRLKDHEETGFNKNSPTYNYPLYKAIRKYGVCNFKIEILEHCCSSDELNSREIYYIAEYDSIIDHNKGYNLEYGGNNGVKSEFTRAKMSKSQSGKNNPSYNRKGDNALRAIKVIDLDTGILYGSMIHCAEELFGDPKAMKQLSKVTNLDNTRISYKHHCFARVDKNNYAYIKLKVAELYNLNVNANGKSYIIIPVEDLLNTLSKRA